MRALLVAACLAALTASCFGQAVLRKGDVFELRIGGVPTEAASDWAFQYTVADNGKVKFPYIGELTAESRSVREFATAIERRLVEEKIFTKPVAFITLQPQSRFVTIGGEVRAPGAVPWTDGLTLFAAVSRAGGLSEWGGKARLVRDGKRQVFDLRKRDKDPRQNPKLLPGDELEVF